MESWSSTAAAAMTRSAQRVAADVVLSAPRGRARQMNAGAARATGDLLLFLHADCQLQAGALAEAARLLTKPDIVAGCFTMTVRTAECCTVRLTLHLGPGAAHGVDLRRPGLVYARANFDRLGGFPALRLMEDVIFSRALSRRGRVLVAPLHHLLFAAALAEDGVDPANAAQLDVNRPGGGGRASRSLGDILPRGHMIGRGGKSEPD